MADAAAKEKSKADKKAEKEAKFAAKQAAKEAEKKEKRGARRREEGEAEKGGGARRGGPWPHRALVRQPDAVRSAQGYERANGAGVQAARRRGLVE